MNIVLIGHRASGKSSVGRRLAISLGRDFVDTDELIVSEAGMTIRAIFEHESKTRFQARERDVVHATAAGDAHVIAVNDSAVVDDENRRLLRASGVIVWLRASAEVLWERASRDAATHAMRPDLTDAGGPAEVLAMLARREPMYRSMSQLTIDTESMDPDRVCQRIKGELADRGLL